jgi:hypothetical protein
VLSLSQSGPTEKARETISTSLNYLRARRSMIDYAKFQQAGFPIGSGAGEACHKFVIQTRLKGTGMRWAPVHVNVSAVHSYVGSDRGRRAVNADRRRTGAGAGLTNQSV